ncbi:MAG TPA: NADH-quinone oxidoreductase subunit C [Roseiflexaceae bacterium]|nr:NADH-quinone oxidoreductase subunit C [Roseiflexaceae bacterium]
MAPLSREEFKQRLARDLPGALAPTPTRAPREGDGQAPPGEAPARPRPRKGEEGPPNLLATDDAVVYAGHIPAVARYLRDILGYEYLSNITAVDMLADGVIELVYHFYHLQGGPPLVVKTRVPREDPAVPSLTPEWPGAGLQEREAYDLFGVRFPGHPDLRRVYMWDEFEGFPMRKDFPKQGDKYLAEDSED